MTAITKRLDRLEAESGMSKDCVGIIFNSCPCQGTSEEAMAKAKARHIEKYPGDAGARQYFYVGMPAKGCYPGCQKQTGE